MGLTYKLLPLELGADNVSPHWSLAASVLINVVFWGVFFSYAYDWPALRMASAALGLAGVVCHTIQVRMIARYRLSASMWVHAPPSRRERGKSQRETESWEREVRSASLPYTQASCAFGVVAALLALLLTTGVAGDSFGVEYAYGYAAGAGWFGLYVTGQAAWLIPLLWGDAHEQARDARWMDLECRSQVVGTALVTIGLLTGVSLIVALGAAVNLAASLLVIACSVRLCWAQPAMAERS
jgi:hypothetical protein